MREEAAPIEPARRAIRWWLALVALVLGGLGWAFVNGAGVPGIESESAALSLSAAGTLLTIAALPFPYGVRASLSLLVAAITMVLGLRGSGPLSGLAIDGGQWRDAARLGATTLLAAALFFRSLYAEYGRSRVLLLIAFGLAVPFMVAEVVLLADTGVTIALRSWAALNTLLCVASLLGLMNAAAGVGSNALGALLLLLIPGEIALRAWTSLAGPDSGRFTYPLTAVAFVAVTLLASLSLFQLLSWALAPEARRLSQVRAPRA